MKETRLKQKAYPYLLIAPTLIAIGIILLYPMLKGLILSFQNYVLSKPVPANERFIGLGNYITMFQDEIFWTSLQKTFWWVVVSVSFQLVIGLVTALLLNQEFPGRALARGIVLIPWVMPSVVSGLMWAWIFDGTFGLVNDILMKLDLISQNIPWLGNPKTAFGVVIATNIWKGFPFFAISILAGLQSIPKELYEAAEIDGAGVWRRFITVTIPHLKPVIITTTVLRLIWTANTTDLIFTMTSGGPGYSTHVLALYTYLKAWSELDFGYSSAMAIILMMILLVFIGLYMRLVNKNKETDII